MSATYISVMKHLIRIRIEIFIIVQVPGEQEISLALVVTNVSHVLFASLSHAASPMIQRY